MAETDQVETDKSEVAAQGPVPSAAKATKAVVVVGSGAIPKGYDFSVVTEAVAKAEDGSPVGKNSDFAHGASAYLRYDPAVHFPPKAKAVFTMGDNLKQHNFWGFTKVEGFVNVGPAHPAFAAANLAFQAGATTIDIIGLTDGEKERLKVFFDALPTDAVEPAQVAVNLV